MITSIYPIVMVELAPEIISEGCFMPPPIGNILLVNDGQQGYADQVGNFFYVGYKSDTEPTDVIGNYSADGITWTPALSGSDPSSHFVFAIKDFPGDCAFFPVFDLYNSSYALAWEESQPTGIVNLKYTDISVQGNTTTPPVTSITTNPSNPVNQSTFYVYPRITLVGQSVSTENASLSDIIIRDIAGNKITIDTTKAYRRGVDLTLPAPVASFSWTQSFRQNSQVNGTLTTIPTQPTFFGNPLPNINIKIYFGTTRILKQTITTDIKGYYSVNLNAGRYTFEVESGNTSVNVSQQLL